MELEKKGLEVVPSVLLTAGEDVEMIEETMRKKNWEMCVVKPAVGSFGNSVLLLRSQEIPKKLKHLRTLLEKVVLLVTLHVNLLIGHYITTILFICENKR